MIDPPRAALSGVKAFERKTAVVAHNVANVSTDEFKKSRTVFEEVDPSGVKVTIDRVDTPGAILDAGDGGGESRETSNVELGAEMGSLMIARRGYGANLTVLRAWDEMTEAMIDLFA